MFSFKSLIIILVITSIIKGVLVISKSGNSQEEKKINQEENKINVVTVLQEFENWANWTRNSYQQQVQYFMEFTIAHPDKAIDQWNLEVYNFFEIQNFDPDRITRIANSIDIGLGEKILALDKDFNYSQTR